MDMLHARVFRDITEDRALAFDMEKGAPALICPFARLPQQAKVLIVKSVCQWLRGKG